MSTSRGRHLHGVDGDAGGAVRQHRDVADDGRATTRSTPAWRVDTPGTVDVAAGSLIVANAVPQVSGAVLDRRHLAGRRVARPDRRADVDDDRVRRVRRARRRRLVPQALRPRPASPGRCASPAASDLTTGSLVNVGTVAVGPTEPALGERHVQRAPAASSLASPGRRRPASSATSSPPARSRLGGTGAVERDPALQPVARPTCSRSLRGADVTSQFGTVDAPGLHAVATRPRRSCSTAPGRCPWPTPGPTSPSPRRRRRSALVLDGTGSDRHSTAPSRPTSGRPPTAAC